MSDSNIGQLAALIKAVKDMGGYESTREQLAAAIGERDPNNVLVTGSVSSDWLLELTFRIDALERRIERIEKLLSHKTGKHDCNQEEQGGADELADD